MSHRGSNTRPCVPHFWRKSGNLTEKDGRTTKHASHVELARDVVRLKRPETGRDAQEEQSGPAGRLRPAAGSPLWHPPLGQLGRSRFCLGLRGDGLTEEVEAGKTSWSRMWPKKRAQGRGPRDWMKWVRRLRLVVDRRWANVTQLVCDARLPSTPFTRLCCGPPPETPPLLTPFPLHPSRLSVSVSETPAQSDWPDSWAAFFFFVLLPSSDFSPLHSIRTDHEKSSQFPYVSHERGGAASACLHFVCCPIILRRWPRRCNSPLHRVAAAPRGPRRRSSITDR